MREHRIAQKYIRPKDSNWSVKILLCSALTEMGISDLWDTILSHRESKGEKLQIMRRDQELHWIWSNVHEFVQQDIQTALQDVWRTVQNDWEKGKISPLDSQFLREKIALFIIHHHQDPCPTVPYFQLT